MGTAGAIGDWHAAVRRRETRGDRKCREERERVLAEFCAPFERLLEDLPALTRRINEARTAEIRRQRLEERQAKRGLGWARCGSRSMTGGTHSTAHWSRVGRHL